MPETAVHEGKVVRATNQSRNKSNPSRHSLKCVICNHPDRAAIEFDFLNWRNPGDLVKGYRFRGLSTIYRHAHATGLFAKRRLNLRFAMERIVERVNEVPVTATAVIRAARAIARINDSGEWVDPPSRVIVTHINRPEDCEAISIAEAEASPPPRRRGTTKITAGSARSSLRAPRASRLSLDTSARSGGRGLSPDIKRRSSKRSIRARPAGQGSIPDIAAPEYSAVSRAPVIFDKELLDEPSDSSSAELPRIDGKPAPPEIILQLTPEFGSAVLERRRAIEADRQAKASAAAGAVSCSGGFTPPASPQIDVPSSSSSLPQAAFQNSAPSALPHPAANENNVADLKQTVATPSTSLPPAAVEEPARRAERSASRSTDRESLVGRGFNRDINDGSLPSSSLPQAVFPNSAPSALPHPATNENNVADVKQSVAMPSTSLPPAAPDKPATAKQSPRAAGPPLGSSGSADPPFPFTPEPLRRWKPRRRF